jgi:hypothetical protein
MTYLLKFAVLVVVLSTLFGCTGSIYNKEKNCSYDYLLTPGLSISKMIGGCGPTDK